MVWLHRRIGICIMRNPLAYQFPPKLGPVDHVPWMPDGRCSLMAMRAVMAASGRGAAYIINQSIRFNDNDSAYMYRTPSVAGNRKTWTWSGWVKRGNLDKVGGSFAIFGAGSAINDRILCNFNGSGYNIQLYTDFGGVAFHYAPTQLYKDISAWYHLVFAMDTTQATATDRFNLYVNGELVTSYSTRTDPALNYDTLMNSVGDTQYRCIVWRWPCYG